MSLDVLVCWCRYLCFALCGCRGVAVGLVHHRHPRLALARGCGPGVLECVEPQPRFEHCVQNGTCQLAEQRQCQARQKSASSCLCFACVLLCFPLVPALVCAVVVSESVYRPQSDLGVRAVTLCDGFVRRDCGLVPLFASLGLCLTVVCCSEATFFHGCV